MTLAEEFVKHYTTISDYARIKGITRQGVFKAIKEGRLPAVRVGRTWYVAKEANGGQQSDFKR